MFVVKIPHDVLEFIGELIGNQFGRVGQAVHHIRDAPVLQSFGDDFPTVLNQLRSVCGIDAFFDHLVIAKQ